jgi:hypothetical protein
LIFNRFLAPMPLIDYEFCDGALRCVIGTHSPIPPDLHGGEIHNATLRLQDAAMLRGRQKKTLSKSVPTIFRQSCVVDVLAAPPDAIDGSGANTRVFKIDGQGTIHIVPVQLGMETARQVEIQQGVSESDLVVAGRRAGLKEGDRVSPVMATFVNAGGKHADVSH